MEKSFRNRPTKYQVFEDAIIHWAEKLNVDFQEIKRDNRYKCHLVTEWYTDGSIMLKYNTRRLAWWSYEMIMGGVFHEIGHIVNNLPYKTEKQQILSEYKAERYCLRMIQKYYPSLFPILIKQSKKSLSNRRFQNDYPIHYKAFSRIKEYQ